MIKGFKKQNVIDQERERGDCCSWGSFRETGCSLKNGTSLRSRKEDGESYRNVIIKIKKIFFEYRLS